MVVGLLRLRLHLPASHSLKDRRAVVRRVTDRVRARYNVSVAEVGDNERWQVATLAVSVVSTERTHVQEVLDKVTSAVASAVAGAAVVSGREVSITSYAADEVLPGSSPMDDAAGLEEKFGGSEEA